MRYPEDMNVCIKCGCRNAIFPDACYPCLVQAVGEKKARDKLNSIISVPPDDGDCSDTLY